MPKEWFQDINFRTKSRIIIMQANEIIEEYKAEGLTLTLRQLYYQFVARDLLPNNQRSYDNLGKIVSNGRLAGYIDWSAIEDRTRFLRGNTNWNSPEQIIRNAARGYSIDMWANQKIRFEVWIEKDALIGVVENVCRKNDIDYFACRGYVSQSELYKAGKRIERYFEDEDKETIVLHLGDHDPSGIDMTRDNQERLCMFSGYDVDVRRIALNKDQIDLYKPPPNPAKLTDSRAGGYVAEHGNYSWELDALEPRVLRNLIQDEVDIEKDQDAWEEREKLLEEHKEKLSEVVDYIESGEDYVKLQEDVEQEAAVRAEAETVLKNLFDKNDTDAWEAAEYYIKNHM